MINFCEDCGEKNTLMPSQLIDGKAVFKCAHCGYQNAYTMDSPTTGNFDKINSFLKQILTHPHIIGSFVFHLQNQVIINHMPGLLRQTDLRKLGKLLTNSYMLCHTEYPDIEELTLQVAGKTLTVQMVNQIIAIVIVTKTNSLPEKIKHRLSYLISTL